MEKAYCPHCITLLEFDPEVRWKTADCPSCGKEFMVDPTFEPPPLTVPTPEQARKKTYSGPTFQQSFSIPDREPYEDDITEKQFRYILHLCIDIDPEEVRKLGKWQASSLIDQIKTTKELLTEQHLQNKGGCMIVLLAGLVGSFFLLSKVIL